MPGSALVLGVQISMGIDPPVLVSIGGSIGVSMILWAAIGWLTFPYATSFEYASPRCAQCGYDLTANVSGICPECGSGVPSQPPA